MLSSGDARMAAGERGEGRGLFLLLPLLLSLSSGRDLRATFNLRRERKIDHILGTEEKRAEEEEGREGPTSRAVCGGEEGLTNTFPPLFSTALPSCMRPPARDPHRGGPSKDRPERPAALPPIRWSCVYIQFVYDHHHHDERRRWLSGKDAPPFLLPPPPPARAQDLFPSLGSSVASSKTFFPPSWGSPPFPFIPRPPFLLLHVRFPSRVPRILVALGEEPENESFSPSFRLCCCCCCSVVSVWAAEEEGALCMHKLIPDFSSLSSLCCCLRIIFQALSMKSAGTE